MPKATHSTPALYASLMLQADRNRLEDLVAPVLLVAFEGWVSAGSAGTATADHIAAGAPTVARFDSDALYDYRVSRPTADFHDGVLGDVEWPEMTIRRVSGERDLLVLTGPEPNWSWRGLATAVAELAGEVDFRVRAERIDLARRMDARRADRQQDLVEFQLSAGCLVAAADDQPCPGIVDLAAVGVL